MGKTLAVCVSQGAAFHHAGLSAARSGRLLKKDSEKG